MRLVLPTPRTTVWLPALAVVLFASVYVPLAGNLLQTTVATQTVAASPTPKTTSPPSAVPITVATSTPTQVQAPALVPKCTPLTFGTSELTLDSSATGLRIQNDAPTYYQIYGNTASDLRTQIAKCAPSANGSSSAEYTGETSYNLTWQYSVTVDSDGCTLRNVQVGLHITTALPVWQPTASATAGLGGRWQQFASSLATHEHGHAQLDANYASYLLQQLNGLGTIDCNNITSTVQAAVNAVVGSLNAANDTYDHQTNHGETQGAVLPNY